MKLRNVQNKGITLIALVVTIIVLLILAAITLNFVFSGGIIDKAKEGAEKTKIAEEIEKIKLSYSILEMAYIEKGHPITVTNFWEELKNYEERTEVKEIEDSSELENKEIVIERSDGTGYASVTFTDTHHTYIITLIDIDPNLQNYNVIYLANGGTGGPVQQTKIEGKDLIISVEIPIRNGYIFKGWGLNSDTTEIAYQSGEKYTQNSSITLYAIWEERPYNITYELNGGNDPGNPTTYSPSLTVELKRPTKDGYAFTGWTGTGLISLTKNVTIPKGSYGDRKYTANWGIPNYIVDGNQYAIYLEDALLIANNGSTIEVIRNVQDIGTVSIDKNVILELHGYTIQIEKAINIQEGGNLIILDSGNNDEYTGKIINTEGVAVDNKGTLQLGSNDGSIYFSPNIEGGTTAIITTGTFKYYDGQITGPTAINGDNVETPTNYYAMASIVNEKEVVNLRNLGDAVARIGYRYYPTLQDAVDAVESGTTQIETEEFNNVLDVLEANGAYCFINQDGKLIPNNQEMHNSTANSYIPIDLQNYSKNELIQVTINASISSEQLYDFGYATITQNISAPEHSISTGRFMYISGTVESEDYTTELEGGKKYYLHIGYTKDSSNNSGDDQVVINNINIINKTTNEAIKFQKIHENITTPVEQTKIVIVAPITIINEIENPNKNISIDLNGKKVNWFNPIINKGKLEILDSSAEQSGEMILSNEGTNNSNRGKLIHNTGYLKISSGKLITENKYTSIIENLGTTEITGGTLSLSANYSYGVHNLIRGNLKLSAGIIMCNPQNDNINIYIYAINNTEGCNVEMTGGIIEMGDISTSYTSYIYGIYNIGVSELTGGNINFGNKNKNYCVYNVGKGLVKIKDNIKTNGDYCIYNKSKESKIEMTGGELTPASEGYGIYNELGIVNILDGKIKYVTNQYTHGIHNDSSGTIVIGVKDGYSNITTPEIQSYYSAITNRNSSGKLYFYDGILKTKSSSSAISGNIEEIEDGYSLKSEYGTDQFYSVYATNQFVVEMNSIKYYSLKSAIEEIPENHTQQVTIKIIANHIDISELVIGNKNILIDLNGKSITISGKIENNATLEIVDNLNSSGKIEFSNIGSESDYKNGIKNNNILKITSGIIESSNSYINLINNTGELIINGGRITTKETYSYAIYQNSENTLNINSGTISTNSSNSYNIYNALSSDINITNVTMTSSNGYSYTIYNKSTGNINISGGTIRSNSYDSTTIYNAASGNINITGGTIEAHCTSNSSISYGIYNNSNGNVNVTGGTINATVSTQSYYIVYGIYNNSNGIITIGEKDGTVNINAPEIKSDSTGIYNNKDGKLYFYDGKIKSREATITGNITEVENEYNIKIGTETETISNKEVIFNTIYLEKYKIAKIGTTEYETLQNAIDSIADGNSEQITITMINDASAISETNIENKNIAIDINGKSINFINKINNSGTLEIKDTSVEIIGKMSFSEQGSTSEYGKGIINKGTLKITSGNIDMNGLYIYMIENEGQVEIIGGRIITTGIIPYSIYNKETGSIKITGGNIESKCSEKTKYSRTAYGIYNNGTGQIEITGGKIRAIYPEQEGYNNTYSYGIYNYSTGEIKINGGNIEIENYSNSIYYSRYSYGIYNKSSGKITIEDGTINAIVSNAEIGNSYTKESYGIYNASNCTLEVLNGTITSIGTEYNSYGIYNYQNTTNTTIGKKDDNVNISSPIIKGETSAIYVNEQYSSKLNIYDGTLQGKISSIDGEITDTETGYNIKTIIDENGYNNSYLEKYYIAQIGTDKYYSLQEAINSIDEGNTEPVTIKIIVDSVSTLETKTGNRNIIIDLNGRELQVTSTIYNTGTLEIQDNSEEKTGKIMAYSNYFDIIKNTANMKITSGVIEINGRSSYGIENNGAKANFELIDGTISILSNSARGIYNTNSGKVFIKGGNIVSNINNNTTTGYVYGIYSTTGNIEITGGTIDIRSISKYYSNYTYGIYQTNGTTIIKDSIINSYAENTGTSNGSTSNGIYNSNSGNIIVLGGSISASGKVADTSSQVPKAYGIFNNLTGKIIVGEQGGQIQTTTPDITADTYGIQSANTGLIYFYDGVIRGKSGTINGSLTAVEDGYQVGKTQVGEYIIDTLIPIGGTITVATIGNVTYQAVQDAINVCSEGQTIVLQRDIELHDDLLTIKEGKNVIINLNGRIISSRSEKATIINQGTLLIKDTSIGAYGTVESRIGKAIENRGTLTIGENNENVSLASPRIMGITIGIDNVLSTEEGVEENTIIGILNLYDGIISGTQAIIGKIQSIPEGYKEQKTENNGIETITLRNAVMNVQYSIEEFVIKIQATNIISITDPEGNETLADSEGKLELTYIAEGYGEYAFKIKGLLNNEVRVLNIVIENNENEEGNQNNITNNTTNSESEGM